MEPNSKMEPTVVQKRSRSGLGTLSEKVLPKRGLSCALRLPKMTLWEPVFHINKIMNFQEFLFIVLWALQEVMDLEN